MSTQASAIRQVTPRDCARIAEIYNHYVQHTCVSFEETPLAREAMQARIDAVLDAGFPWLVALDGGRVCGFAYGNTWNPRTAYRFSAEVTIYVDPDILGKGLGFALYQQLFKDLQRMGKNTVIGGIALPNPASIALHEKMGMRKVAHFHRVGFKFGQWIDTGYWQGEL